MIGAIFSEVSFEGLFAVVFGVGTKSEVLDDVGDFVNFGTLRIAHTGTKLKLRVHHASARDVN